jgi:hypothetical protein
MKKEDDILTEFDAIIEEAPVDFLGTGSNSRWADQCAKKWLDRVKRLRERIALLLKDKND